LQIAALARDGGRLWAEGLEEGLEDLTNLDDFDNVEMHAALRFTRNITGCNRAARAYRSRPAVDPAGTSVQRSHRDRGYSCRSKHLGTWPSRTLEQFTLEQFRRRRKEAAREAAVKRLRRRTTELAIGCVVAAARSRDKDSARKQAARKQTARKQAGGCQQCGPTDTSRWRGALCNACGLVAACDCEACG